MTHNDDASGQTNTPNSTSVSDRYSTEWDRVKDFLKKDIGDTAFRSWIRPLSLLGVDGLTLQIGTPTRFMKDWVQSHYADQIVNIWDHNVQKIHTIDFIIQDVKTPAPITPASSDDAEIDTLKNDASNPLIANQNLYNTQLTDTDIEGLSSPLDPRFTFDRFVLGKSNELACAAARRVTETETVSFNPLYLYGGVGLGKTHLMHAVGNLIIKQNPNT